MMNKKNHTMRILQGIRAAFLLATAFVAAQPYEALAQCPCPWGASGNNINNTNTGNVGIGTTNPLSSLHIVSTPNAIPRGLLVDQYSDDAWSSTIFLRKSRGTTASPASVMNLDNLGFITIDAFDGTAYRNAGRIRFSVDGPVTNGSVPGNIQFQTGGLIERMRITSAGNVGIGTTNPTERLEIFAGSLYMHGESGGIIVDSAGLKRVGLIKYTGKEAGIWRVSDQDFEIGRVSTQVAALPGAPTAFTTDLYVAGNGDIGVGTTAPTARLHVVGDLAATGTGNISAAGTITAGNIVAKYQDIAEWVPASHTIPAGTVVVLDTGQRNHVIASSQAYDTRVAGVVTASPGVILGEAAEGKVMVATTGRVRVKVDAIRAPIRVGDLLVTSDREGIAMRSEPLSLGGTPIHRPGTLIGKALEPLDKGVGEILVLLSLQ